MKSANFVNDLAERCFGCVSSCVPAACRAVSLGRPPIRLPAVPGTIHQDEGATNPRGSPAMTSNFDQWKAHAAALLDTVHRVSATSIRHRASLACTDLGRATPLHLLARLRGGSRTVTRIATLVLLGLSTTAAGRPLPLPKQPNEQCPSGYSGSAGW